jgi:hypothetical protein
MPRKGRVQLRPISPEQLRILVAAAESRLTFEMSAYRYSIEGEASPDRKEREKLQKRGLLSRPSGNEPVLTERGREALAHAPVVKSQPRSEQLSIAPSTQEVAG